MRLAQAAVWLGASLPRSSAGIWHSRDVSATVFTLCPSAMLRRTHGRFDQSGERYGCLQNQMVKAPGLEIKGRGH